MMAGSLSVGMILLMLGGCVMLWVGFPVAWLWIGSQIQNVASLGAAMAVIICGIVFSIVATTIGLAYINRAHTALQLRRGRRPIGGASVLEVMLVSSAGVAVVVFGIWFFVFAGASPLPLNIGF